MSPRIVIASLIAALLLQVPAYAQPRVKPLDNGNVSVDMQGCSVVFDRRGRVVTSGGSCNERQMTRAREEFAGYQREEGQRQRHRGDEYADGDAGGPDAWQVHGAPNGGLELLDRPSSKARPVTARIRNGERVRNLGCSRHEDQRWCHVEYRGERGWTRQRWLREASGAPPAQAREKGKGKSDGPADELYVMSYLDEKVALMDRPSRNGRALVDDLRDGERVRNRGCGLHNGDAWCEVDYGGRRGWIRQRWLKESPAGGQAAGGDDRRERDRQSGHGGLRIEHVKYGLGDRHCNATQPFAAACNGRGECQVNVGNQLCGDPVRGDRKTAEIVYRCDGRSQRLAVREGERAQLRCP